MADHLDDEDLDVTEQDGPGWMCPHCGDQCWYDAETPSSTAIIGAAIHVYSEHPELTDPDDYLEVLDATALDSEA